MKAAIKTAQMRKDRTSELAAEARGAHERYDLYQAKTLGQTMTSPAKLRELKQACDLSDARLRLAWVAPDSPEQAREDLEPIADGEQV